LIDANKKTAPGAGDAESGLIRAESGNPLLSDHNTDRRILQ